MSKSDGGPAFPNAIDNSGGISVRDYFAAKAMQGMLSIISQNTGTIEKCASWAYEYADAMLKERERE